MLQRSLSLMVLLILGLVLAAEPGQAGGHTLNILDRDASAFNREVGGLLAWVMGFAALVFVVVTGALTYVTIKFRRTGKETGEPEQMHGNDRLEVAWTVIPTVIVLIIFGLTAQSMFKLDRPSPGAMVVEVTGYQFWWDFHYPALGLRNSNELILPAGVPVELEITSKDVIHSFWVPGLAGKRDAIPGQKTLLHFTPKEPGNYYGFCAELCGPSHSRMLFRVLVVPKEEFDRFVEAAKAYTPPVADARGRPGADRARAGSVRGGELRRLPQRGAVRAASGHRAGARASRQPHEPGGGDRGPHPGEPEGLDQRPRQHEAGGQDARLPPAVRRRPGCPGPLPGGA